MLSFWMQGQTKDALVDSLENIVKTEKENHLKGSAYSSLGWRLIVLGQDPYLIKKNLDSASIIFKALNDTLALTDIEYKYGVMYRFQGDFKNANNSFDKILPIYKSRNDSNKIANTLYQKGVVFEMMGEYDKSLKQFLTILKIYEAQDNKRGIGLTMNSLGVVYTKLNKLQDAIESFNNAIIIHQERNEFEDIANSSSNLADVYLLQDNLELANKYYTVAREINLKSNNQWGLSFSNQKIAEILFLDKKYAETIPYLNEALDIQRKNAYKSEMAFTLALLGKAHRNLGNFKKAESYLKTGLYNVTNAKEPISNLHQELYLLYKQNKEYEKAITHLELFNSYSDSLLNETSTKTTNKLLVQFESEKKDKELAEQKLAIEENQLELQKKKTQYSIMTGFTIFLLVSSLLGWFLYQQRQKRKNQEILTLKREQQVRTLESLMEGEEKERFRIAKELHDGVNGDLSAIKYKLTSMLDHNTAVVNEVVAMIDKSSEQVRAISHNLVPPSLEKFNLIEALEDYCATMNDVHEPLITYQHLGEQIEISKNNEINMYRIVQELVSNSIKHSGAETITVQTSHRENTIQLTVEDNGSGFDALSKSNGGIGLKNIDSRIDYLNATKDIISNIEGTSYTIEIDITKLNDH